MASFRGANAKSLIPGFSRVLFNAWKERPLEGKSLVNMRTSTRAFEEDFEFAGFGTLQLKPEGAEVLFEDPKQGDTKRYVWDTFAKGYTITMELKEDELYAIFGSKLASALGRSARNNYEIICHMPYNNAFNTAFTGFTAGESLVDDHVSLKTGLSIRNGPLTPADIDITSLQAGIEHFKTLVDHVGMPIVLIPKLLIHNPGDYWIANQLIKTDKLPGSNFNDVNMLKQQGLMTHESHYLVDDDSWFLQADWHDVNMWERRKFTFRGSDDFDTGDSKFRGMARRGSGFGSWRGIYGSAGES
jgi:hypothetical protein